MIPGREAEVFEAVVRLLLDQAARQRVFTRAQAETVEDAVLVGIPVSALALRKAVQFHAVNRHVGRGRPSRNRERDQLIRVLVNETAPAWRVDDFAARRIVANAAKIDTKRLSAILSGK